MSHVILVVTQTQSAWQYRSFIWWSHDTGCVKFYPGLRCQWQIALVYYFQCILLSSTWPLFPTGPNIALWKKSRPCCCGQNVPRIYQSQAGFHERRSRYFLWKLFSVFSFLNSILRGCSHPPPVTHNMWILFHRGQGYQWLTDTHTLSLPCIHIHLRDTIQGHRYYKVM